MSVISEPGIYDLPAAAYHADPCVTPSLSASIVSKMIDDSPRHARHAHPRLNLAREPEQPTAAQGFGDVVHRLFLGAGKSFVEVDAADWRTKDAKKARDDALEAGKTPVLPHVMAECRQCVMAMREQIVDYPVVTQALLAGRAEQTVVWRDVGGVLCRSLVDWLPDDPAAPLIDIKTTAMSANPERWERRMVAEYAVQSSFHPRGVVSVRGGATPGMLFVVVEQNAPYALSVVAAAPSLEAMARDMTEHAIALWSECLRTDKWPGYAPEIAWVEAPAWALYRHEDRRMRRGILQSRTEGEQYQRLVTAAGGPPA